MTTSSVSSCHDNWFGPVLDSSCRGGFDFTVLFEASILTVTPAALFLLLVPLRLFYLAKQSPKVHASTIHAATLVALLALVATNHVIEERISLVGAVLELLAALAIVILVDLEHIRSIRPSFLVSAYLFTTLLLDLARVRTAWLIPESRAYSACLTTSVALKLLLLGLENVEKRKWLLPDEKSRSGESISGPFNRGLFAWLNGLLRQGYTVLLTGEALPNIHEKLASSDLSRRFSDAWSSCDQSRQNALLLAVIRCLRWEIAGIAFPRLCLVGFNIAQPFLVSKVVTVLEETNSLSLDKGYGLIGATAIVFVGNAVATASYEHLGYRSTTMIRGGLMALAFQHMMDLPLGSTDESSAMSLMGADIEMLAEYFQTTVCETWANVVQLVLAVWLLETEVGAVCIAPIVVVIVFTALSFAMGNAVSVRQKSWLQATEKRINFTSEVIGSIRNVKFLGLTETMSERIEALRISELQISKKFRRVQSARICMVNLPQIVGQLGTFGAYAIVAKVQGSGGLSVSQAITSLSLINLLINPLRILMRAIPDTFASMGCLHRVEDFLRQTNRLDKRQIPRLEVVPSSPPTSVSDIELSHLPPNGAKGSFALGTQPDSVISLQNVRFGWKPSSLDRAGLTLNIAASPSGSLIAIVGAVGSGKSTFLKGLAGETSLLEGDLFVKYPDLAFCDQSPWLSNASIRENIIGAHSPLDFDAAWYRTVVSACALDLDVQRMPAGDRTLVGSKGAKLSGGQKQRIAIARAVYARKRIACFDDVLSGLDNATGRLVFNNVFGPAGLLRRLGCLVFLATHSVHHLPQADSIIVLEDGQVLEQGSYIQLRSKPGGYVQRLSIHLGQTDDIEGPGDDQPPRSEETGPVDGPTQADGAGVGGFRDIWIELWASSSDSAWDSRLGYWLGLYGVFSFLEASGIALAVYWVWVVIVPTASKNLHSTVLRACMGAPFSFLSNVETGALVTRFSQDMRLVDMTLPGGVISTGFQLTGTLAQGAIAIASLPYLAATLPFLVGLLVLIQRFYLRTSRQLRLLEIELKSPLYTHFIESLAGVTTIRAFSWTRAYTSRMFSKLDEAQRPYYLLLCIQRWLDLVLNLVVAALTVLMVGAAVALRRHIDPGLLGIALLMMMDLGQTLSALIQGWTLLETSLGAIARIKDFVEDTPKEDTTTPEQAPHPEWPSRGAITFSNATISYSSDQTNPVLHDIHLQIQAGQKIGLCGRTGSGKSSLALSLLRLNELVSGQILIDSQDISVIPRSLVRQRISGLSQDPFLFPGTVRQNADPLDTATDSDIITALECVGVWDALVSASASASASVSNGAESPLDTPLNETTLSQGQKQLFSLARALLTKSKILILDEPTSSLDAETDATVQTVIREAFRDCTVIMVAHRIHTLLDMDLVAVMDGGRLVEVGAPRDLLERPEGAFARLLRLEAGV
ncbi:multidrug resistance-associated protein [Aspergillus heteromorphus CBS 117.55]|uniref:Multidrug resistance-associated protein n=1 Tax=Aspergillus heteromorphus CBS 117.55 TaxID=1448321 RepID=A0A317WSY7_9EURO|nr:multidrug resistance-associated protein [Aspergillus heteromorphus CBS 117.55]PWY88307.1 multidrug resistance-associated protein [Aspergillus heteromorphus CBS 117.55]